MTKRVLLCGVWMAAMPALLVAAPPDAKPQARIEFRWLEDKPIPGVTEDKGFKTTCGDALSYAHLKPVLTNKDVADAKVTHHDFSKNGLSGNLYMVALHLKESARKTLIAECGDAASRELAVFVDGKYWGTGYFRKAQAASYVQSVGFMSSQLDAERVADACK